MLKSNEMDYSEGRMFIILDEISFSGLVNMNFRLGKYYCSGEEKFEFFSVTKC